MNVLGIGSRVRVRTHEEFVTDPHWDLHTTPWNTFWTHTIDGSMISPVHEGRVGIVHSINIEYSYAEVDTTEGQVRTHYHLDALVLLDVPSPACECGKEKHGFEWHSRWCGMYTNPMEGRSVEK